MASERDDQAPPPAPREPLRRVGIRQLKQQTSEVVRRVREDHETVDITLRGEVVARIGPVDETDGTIKGRPARAEQRERLGTQAQAPRSVAISSEEKSLGLSEAEYDALQQRHEARRRLAEEISVGWPHGLSAAEAVAEGRDERW